MSAFVTVPPTLILVQMFRRSRFRKTRTMRLKEIMKKTHLEKNDNGKIRLSLYYLKRLLNLFHILSLVVNSLHIRFNAGISKLFGYSVKISPVRMF